MQQPCPSTALTKISMTPSPASMYMVQVPVQHLSTSVSEHSVSVNSIDINSVNSSTSIPTDIAVKIDPDPAFDRDNPSDNQDNPHHSPDTRFDPDAIHAQIDTSAGVSCTNLKFALHSYKSLSQLSDRHQSSYLAQ